MHFQTRTTMDTLDYSGSGLNEGSKVILAAAGPKRRALGVELPDKLTLPEGFSEPRVCLPGILVIEASAYPGRHGREIPPDVERFCQAFAGGERLSGFPLVVLVDDSDFAARSLNNWLWVTFTRSDPAADVHGVGACTEQKHWGCTGPLVIDARIKPHHAPPLEEDPAITRRVEALGVLGGPLYRIL